MAHYTIDIDRIRNISLRGIRRTAVFLGLGINAADDKSFTKYQLSEHSYIQFMPDQVSDKVLAHFKEEFGIWIIANGIRELVERYALFLDQVHADCLLVGIRAHDITPEQAREWGRAFLRKGVSDKLKALDARFLIRPHHSEYLKTIEWVRNILAHHGGVVRKQSCDESGVFKMQWIAPHLFAQTPSGDVTILQEQSKQDIILPDGGAIKFKMVIRDLSFKPGDVIKVTPHMVVELCNFFFVETYEVLRTMGKYLEDKGIPLRDSRESKSSGEGGKTHE